VPLRRWAARALDVAAVLVVVAAVARFVIIPRLHGSAMAAPALRLATLAGPQFDIAAPRSHVVFLDFYASWCDPCRQAIPLVQRFRRTHPGVEVISIDVGEPPPVVRPFASQFGMRDVALDPDEIAAHAFGISNFPTLLAIDRTSNVHVVDIGYDPGVERVMADASARYGRAAIR
jgi:cytochrome c biogenesis protein CcmG/thiol:disulfide interchange protein DsbE